MAAWQQSSTHRAAHVDIRLGQQGLVVEEVDARKQADVVSRRAALQQQPLDGPSPPQHTCLSLRAGVMPSWRWCGQKGQSSGEQLSLRRRMGGGGGQQDGAYLTVYTLLAAAQVQI